MPRIEREVVVQAPADTVYQIWRNFENLPSLMSNIEEVREESGGRTQWKAKGPLGSSAEWTAEITQDEPARVIAWRSLPGDDQAVQTQGAVRFESEGDATRVHVMLEYEAPAGKVGETVAKIFANPDRQVESDLERFKENVESGGMYMRATERIANVTTSDREEREVRERYPADTYAPADAALGGRSQTQGQRPGNKPRSEPPAGPGMAGGGGVSPSGKRPSTGTNPRYAGAKELTGAGPNPQDGQVAHESGDPEGTSRPVTTGTPGGTLGAPTEAELRRARADESDKQDTRLDPDQG